jgi:predicted AlkP superfamily phosphohydrolase/phosphomutase
MSVDRTVQPHVMVVGLDGLTLTRLLPLVKAGQLPTFARLIQSGAYGILRSVTNMTTGPTWASFATGCQPAEHGIWHDFSSSRGWIHPSANHRP